MRFLRRKKLMGKVKEYYMDLEERYGDTVDKAVQIIDLYPELVQTKMLVKGITNELSNLQINPQAKEAVHRAECRNELVQELSEILTEDKNTNFCELLRWLDNKDNNVPPEEY